MDNEYNNLKKNNDIVDRVYMANRWLAEFDKILKPMWDYILYDSIIIQDAREDIRNEMMKHEKNYKKI